MIAWGLPIKACRGQQFAVRPVFFALRATKNGSQQRGVRKKFLLGRRLFFRWCPYSQHGRVSVKSRSPTRFGSSSVGVRFRITEGIPQKVAFRPNSASLPHNRFLCVRYRHCCGPVFAARRENKTRSEPRVQKLRQTSNTTSIQLEKAVKKTEPNSYNYELQKI